MHKKIYSNVETPLPVHRRIFISNCEWEGRTSEVRVLYYWPLFVAFHAHRMAKQVPVPGHLNLFIIFSERRLNAWSNDTFADAFKFCKCVHGHIEPLAFQNFANQMGGKIDDIILYIIYAFKYGRFKKMQTKIINSLISYNVF